MQKPQTNQPAAEKRKLSATIKAEDAKRKHGQVDESGATPLDGIIEKKEDPKKPQ